MDYGHYTTKTTEEAVRLCNALGGQRGPDDHGSVDQTELRDLLQRFELDNTPLDVEGFTYLARRLRQVFTATDLATRVRVLNDLISLYQPHPYIVEHDDQGHHLHFVPPGTGDLRGVGASMTMALATVLCDFGAGRLGVCPQCDDVFVDTTRNARQRFCSRTCANRVNVAKHRARASES